MALTFPPGPLSREPGTTNYTVSGPAGRILLQPSAKRVRVVVASPDGPRTVVDTTRAVLLHETGHLPRYYVPVDDVDDSVTRPSPTASRCPYKGEASYTSVEVGGRTVEDLFFRYPEPPEQLAELAGLVGLYLEKLDEAAGDAVYEEEHALLGHPHDPFHRVDALPSSRHVRVLWERDGAEEPVVLAETTSPVGVFETSLPPRWYVPAADVRTELLRDSATTTVCPYKGVATYRSLVDGPADVAWAYDEPLPEALPLPGHLCFMGEGIVTEVDGQRV
ncbi:DUF427 domain-containing protein [Aquipuribacter nitratireducens]|uniref:DUF427 domain-containing protein n=1 Tax=Aquipuribacter nitratireducens TaxID=650104 RepID=A0ABW0GSQ0_9MICO